MKYRIEIHPSQEEDLLIFGKAPSPVLQRIEEILQNEEPVLLGFRGEETVQIPIESVYGFYSEDNKTYVLTEKEKFRIRERLYRVEESFGERFLRINQSCLVNPAKIARFHGSVGGSLLVILKNGYQDYVSRRQLKTVKERIGF